MNYLMIFSRPPTNFSGQVTIGLPGFPAWSLLAFQMNCWTRWDIFLGIFHDHYHFANHKCTSLCCKIILFLPCFSWRTRCLTLQCVEFTRTGDKFQISSTHQLCMKNFLSGPAHTWYLPSAIWGQEILHLKVRKFATKLAPGDTFWKFLFFIESGLKLIEFKFNSKQNPEYSFKKYSFNRVQYSIELFTQKNWGKLFKILK